MAFLMSLLLGVYLAPLALSALIINVQPEVISPVFTSQLVINCSVTNNQVPNIDVIKSVSLSRYNETIKDFYVLLSLDTHTFNLQQFVQFRHAQVSFGNLFLSLTVYNPIQSDAQAYRCNVDGDNSVQKNVSMKAKKEVRYEPNVTALIEKITRLMISKEIEQCSSMNVGLSGYNNIRSKLRFVASSEIVKELIEPLTVKCSFPATNDSSYQDSVLQFMYILHETTGVIATISRDQPVTKSGQNLSSNTIQGELYHNLSKDSYLQVTWQNVKLFDSGKYFCGAHVNYVLGQKDRFQEQLVISVQRPTLDDLVKVVHDLQREVGEEKQRREISERNIMNIHEQNIEIVKEDMKINQQNIKNVKEDVKINQQNIKNVKEDVKINQQNIEDVKEDVKINQQNIEKNKEDVKINQQKIENIKEDLKINQPKFENVKKELKINQDNIENIREEVKINQQNLTRLKETIDLLQYNLSNYEGKTNYTSLLQEIQNTLIPESCRGIIHKKERVVVTLASGLKVMCDTKTDGGGWIIFQRRINGKVDFYRGWKEYRDGFGDYNIGEFYLGNENISSLTSTGQYDLRIDLEFNNKKYFAQYENFKVLSETEKYKLKIGKYSGNAGDELLRHKNMFFTTFDRDNDLDSYDNCAEYNSGPWWYADCYPNLNGLWGSTSILKGMTWAQLTGYYNSVSFSEMKIRERK
ncbi:angiopoietin-2-like [Biomphalaria glabrata]|uniref:Angiopoietin-2-like n=1 Tax=Biomphalaria glabrata TaxID=6526 RepID=A0A9W2YKY0_BIOGL|nr:angiopoietin-2-like [Biomphalaria glabrata]